MGKRGLGAERVLIRLCTLSIWARKRPRSGCEAAGVIGHRT
jgi:hypothetical protein